MSFKSILTYIGIMSGIFGLIPVGVGIGGYALTGQIGFLWSGLVLAVTIIIIVAIYYLSEL